MHIKRAVLSRVPIDELRQGLRKKPALIRAALQQLVRYILRYVPRPALCRTKSDNPILEPPLSMSAMMGFQPRFPGHRFRTRSVLGSHSRLEQDKFHDRCPG